MNSPGYTTEFRAVSDSGSDERVRFNAAFYKFIKQIDFQTEYESIQRKNVKKAKKAFRVFCRDMGWILAEQSFEELLDEKKGSKEFRKDGVTPNWYHELRQILPILGMVRSGHIPLDALSQKKYGGFEVDGRNYNGLETLICAALRHDSYEDFGKSPHMLFANLEGRLHALNKTGVISDEELLVSRIKASLAVQIVDNLSSKTKRFAAQPDGNITLETVEFFEGKTNAYYAQTLSHFFSYIWKLTDSIEGLSTRIPPVDGAAGAFAGDDVEYAAIKRALYGQIGMDVAAQRNWSDMRDAISALDAQLEVSLNALELVNTYYHPSTRNKFDPHYALPVRADRAEDSVVAYDNVPKGFHPTHIMLERLEDKARAEIACGEYRMAMILENALYPSYIAKGIIEPERQGSLLNRVIEVDSSSDFTPEI